MRRASRSSTKKWRRKFSRTAEALGQHIRYTQPPRDGSPNDFEIVGIVNAHRHDVQNDTTLRRVFRSVRAEIQRADLSCTCA